MGLFAKRTESEIGSNFEWASRPGTYVAEVTDAYDNRIVYPDDVGKNRYIGPTVRILGLVQDNGESDEDFQDRHDQIGKYSRPRIYLTEKACEKSFKLLTEIAGSATLPPAFAKKVIIDDTNPEDPVYDYAALAENAPVNPGNLIGRRFRVALKLGKGKGLGLDPFKSWLVPESEQTQAPRNLFEGEDTASQKIRDRVAKSKNGSSNGSGRSDGLQFDSKPAVSADADGGLPF